MTNDLVSATFWFSALKVRSQTFPTVIMTNNELAYIEGISITEVKKFVFLLEETHYWGENTIEYTVNKTLNDDKSFFMFSRQDIEKAKSGGKECSITINKEYKLSELQIKCECLYNDINTRISNFNKTITVEELQGDLYISIVSGIADTLSSEVADILINLMKVNPKTYPVKTHYFDIKYKNGIYITNNKIISFLFKFDVESNNLNGSIETDKIISWVDKSDYSEIIIKKLGGNSHIVTKIYSLSSDSDIVHYKGIYETGDNIFLSLVGESMKEEYMEEEIELRLTNVVDNIKYSYKNEKRMRMRMTYINDNTPNKIIKANAIDNWFYEDVTNEYYKGYFISGEDFAYVEKSKSNDAKVLEKIYVEKKIDLTVASPTITLSDTDNDMKINLKETVAGCNGKTEYKIETIKQLCPSANPKFQEVIIEFSKSGDKVSMTISGKVKNMKQSTIKQNTQLINLIGLETYSIPIGKYITHEERYVNDVNILEDHYYRIFERIEMDLSESDKEIKDYIKFGIFLNEREDVGENTELGILHFFTIPNLNNKYIMQRNLTDFYEYDNEFNSYVSDLDKMTNDTNNKLDSIINRIFDFMKDDDVTTTAANTTPDTSDTTAETTITTIPDSTIDPDNGFCFSMNFLLLIIVFLLII